MVANKNAVAFGEADGAGISNGAMLKDYQKPLEVTSDFSELNQLAMSRAEFVLRQLCDGDVFRLIERLDGGFNRTSAAILLGHMQGLKLGEVLQ